MAYVGPYSSVSTLAGGEEVSKREQRRAVNKVLVIGLATVALLYGSVAVATQTLYPLSSDATDAAPRSAVDYCPELTGPLVNTMNSIRDRKMTQLRRNTREVFSVAERATAEGVAVDTPGNQWIAELYRSSDLFLYIIDNGQAEFTDAEFADYLDRIVFWFGHGLAVCEGQAA